MTTCDPDITKFILEWYNVVSLLESHSIVLWRAFELCKDAYFVDYMRRNQESHDKNKIPTPSINIDKLLKFALDKYNNLYQINNHVWG